MSKVDFISGCPGFNCKNSKNSYTWIHNNCGGNEWIHDDGNVECKNCNLKLPLISWKFKCDGHSDFREVNKEKICEILSISASLKNSDLKFQSNMLSSLSKMLK